MFLYHQLKHAYQREKKERNIIKLIPLPTEKRTLISYFEQSYKIHRARILKKH